MCSQAYPIEASTTVSWFYGRLDQGTRTLKPKRTLRPASRLVLDQNQGNAKHVESRGSA